MDSNHNKLQESEKLMQAYLHRLKGRLLEEPGIRYFVPLRFQQDSIHFTIKTINDAFMQLSRFVITGQAGSGKTTMMRRLALQLVNDCLEDEKVKQMPIWFSLSEWDDKQPLENFVRTQWKNIENPFETMYQNNAIVVNPKNWTEKRGVLVNIFIISQLLMPLTFKLSRGEIAQR